MIVTSNIVLVLGEKNYSKKLLMIFIDTHNFSTNFIISDWRASWRCWLSCEGDQSWTEGDLLRLAGEGQWSRRTSSGGCGHDYGMYMYVHVCMCVMKIFYLGYCTVVYRKLGGATDCFEIKNFWYSGVVCINLVAPGLNLKFEAFCTCI
jgi:hypothetical protein